MCLDGEGLREQAIANQRIIEDLTRKLERQTRQIQIIQMLAGDMSSTLELEKIFENILTALTDVFQFEHSMILLKPEGSDLVRVEASRGYSAAGIGAEVLFGQGVIGIVAQKRKMMRMVGIAYRGRYMLTAAGASQANKPVLPGLQDVQSQIAIPLLMKDELIGVLAAESTQLSAFDEVDETLLSILGSQIGASIANARAYRMLAAAHEESLRLRDRLASHEKMATIGDMAAGIVHDLKNPVAIMKGCVEMADDDSIGRSQRREYLEIIAHEGDRMLSLVQDLLDFSQGSVSIRKQMIGGGPYLERVRRAIAPNFQTKGIELIVSGAPEFSVNVDPDRFLRVIMNIAGNAADVLCAGGRFEIGLEDCHERSRFILRDNGPGIPEAIHDSLFEPFVTSGKSHGTGLGMAIARSIVQAHGGRISFETQAGQGTTFTIELPR